jgi:hypothetical protein
VGAVSNRVTFKAKKAQKQRQGQCRRSPWLKIRPEKKRVKYPG